MVKAPFKSIKETLENLKKALVDVVDTVKSFVENIKRIILGICKYKKVILDSFKNEMIIDKIWESTLKFFFVIDNVIKKATLWLGSIINFCNKKIGTPFQRCMKTFDDAIVDCKVI